MQKRRDEETHLCHLEGPYPGNPSDSRAKIRRWTPALTALISLTSPLVHYPRKTSLGQHAYHYATNDQTCPPHVICVTFPTVVAYCSRPEAGDEIKRKPEINAH